MYQIDQTKQVEILRWLMYAWDGQWLGRTSAVYGPTEASKINTRVRAAFGKIEMKALLALLGKKQADNLADATEMLKTYFELAFGERGYQGRFWPVEAAPTGSTRLRIEVGRLTPLDALKKTAQAAGENPAVACEMLWNTWFETLLPEANIQVTLRPNGPTDVYQIDSLAEAFNPANLPVELAATGHGTEADAGVVPQVQPLPKIQNSPAAEELSPIAAALQIPFNQVATTAPNSDPYASGPASYMVSQSSSPAGGLIGAAEPGASSNARGGRASFTDLPASSGSPTANFNSSSIPTPPFGTSNIPSPPFGASAAPPVPDVPSAPAWTPSASVDNPPRSLTIDPVTGRSLFSSDMEAEAREKVGRTKAKNLPLMSRMMLSKQAKEMISKSADQPAPMAISVATNVDLILQRHLMEARKAQPGSFPELLRVVGGPQGELQILNGSQVYYSVDEIPPGPIKNIITRAVQEWSEGQS